MPLSPDHPWQSDLNKKQQYEEAVTFLERIQNFDPTSLARKGELGDHLNFEGAIAPASRLTALFKQLSTDVLETLSSNQLQYLSNHSKAALSQLQTILDFSPKNGGTTSDRDSLINQLKAAYDSFFDSLLPLITYSAHKSATLGRLESEARATAIAIENRSNELVKVLDEHKKQADEVLTAIRKVAEEQGVSQQAQHFKNEADSHDRQSLRWLFTTVALTIILFLYAVGTLFIHKHPWFAPQNVYDTAQLAVSKVLIFGTVSFFLLLAARNYSAHRHNLVVNRHRQNALATFEALANAAGEKANRDIVLTKASECIFEPQPTAFTKAITGDGSYSVVNLNPASIKGHDGA